MNDELKAILDQMELCIEDDEITYEFDDLIEKISDLNFLRRKNKHYHFLLMINKIQHALYVVIF